MYNQRHVAGTVFYTDPSLYLVYLVKKRKHHLAPISVPLAESSKYHLYTHLISQIGMFTSKIWLSNRWSRGLAVWYSLREVLYSVLKTLSPIASGPGFFSSNLFSPKERKRKRGKSKLVSFDHYYHFIIPQTGQSSWRVRDGWLVVSLVLDICHGMLFRRPIEKK
jgi:hypothetical protein